MTTTITTTNAITTVITTVITTAITTAIMTAHHDRQPCPMKPRAHHADRNS